MFCENVSCFLVIDETGNFQLPFSFQVHSCGIRREDNLESHVSALLAEQADSGENAYISPKAMIHKRMGECGLL